MRRAWWLLALSLGGCSPFSATTTGAGAISVGMPEERESANIYVWFKRGADAGELARAYCLQGSKRERYVMRDSFAHHAAPAKVQITCPDE
ncbi:MAG TPA: hypothetical protein VGF29_06955 [Hyphomicrobiaceae bacterium]|jgi:hypothetical protein